MREFNCRRCGAKSRRKGNVFCGSACFQQDRKDSIIAGWLSGGLDANNSTGQLRGLIKRWVKDRDKWSCVACGWSKRNEFSGTIQVEVDHIDGDFTNNMPGNLRTLCPNCHSLTKTWKNTGGGATRRGRPRRRKHFRKVGGEDERTRLESGSPGDGTVGSNPTPSFNEQET